MADDDVPLVVFLIVICSAFVHASWNLATRYIEVTAVLASSCLFGAILLSLTLLQQIMTIITLEWVFSSIYGIAYCLSRLLA